MDRGKRATVSARILIGLSYHAFKINKSRDTHTHTHTHTQDELQWIVAQRLLSALTIPGFS